MARAVRLPIVRRLAAAVAALAFVALAGCTSATREYGEIMRGRSPCNCDPKSPWCDYLSVMKGPLPCPTSGRATCGADCGCAPKPACGGPTPGGEPVSMAPTASPTAMPAEAKAGEAWCRVLVPATYATVSERVQTHCGMTSPQWVPPVYKTEVRRVLVQPARTTTLEVAGASRILERCETCGPARTETRARTTTDACGRCVTACETVTLPPVQRTRTEEICVLSPSSHVVFEPAVYSAEMCEVEVTPGRWETVETAPVFEAVTKRVCVAPERWEWRRNTACAVPTPAVVAPCAPTASK